MSVGLEALDRISHSGEAVFATDSSDRIILWNKKCEELLGRPVRQVLGRRCHEVVGGRDVHGNLYCHRGCPVAFQARERPAQPVNRFSLSVDVDRSERQIRYSMFVLPSYHPALSVLVHVLREEEPETRVARQNSDRVVFEPLQPKTTAAGELIVLTRREKEILLRLAEGMESASVAKRLFISHATVRNHIVKILQKLEVHSKLPSVVFAYQQLGPADTEREDFPRDLRAAPQKGIGH